MPMLELPAPLSAPSSARTSQATVAALQSTTTKPLGDASPVQRHTCCETSHLGNLTGDPDTGERRHGEEQRGDERADVSMDLANSQSQGPKPASPEERSPLQALNGTVRDPRAHELDSDPDDTWNHEEAGGPPLHVEVRLRATSTLRCDLLRRMLNDHLNDEYETLLTHSEVHDWRDVAVLEQNIERVWIGECALQTQAVPLGSVTLELHLYQPPSSSKVTDFSTNPQNDDDGDADVPAASVLELPSRSLEGIWDTLIYDGQVKEKLLGYIHSTMLFSDASVDFNIVTWNRVVLLHGPPGTGKTSLCRSLAQKLAIRLSDRYDHGKLIEINSHSLFSKWFSESGKLVQRLFAQVTEMVDDQDCFVVVLIDEVESLTAARAGAMSGKEPSDALRVVNALLTQLDKLKHRKNCLVMTTSNLSSAIDNAFVDRADIKQYIGLPPTAAIYWILRSCLQEIMRAGLIPPVNLLDCNAVKLHRSSSNSDTSPSHSEDLSSDAAELREWECSLKLYDLAEKCQGMSGRSLRRLPILAHARHVGAHTPPPRNTTKHNRIRMPPIEVWLEAMEKCAEEERVELEKVNEGN